MTGRDAARNKHVEAETEAGRESDGKTGRGRATEKMTQMEKNRQMQRDVYIIE